MTFSDSDKLKALAVVSIFETSRPLGDFGAVAVLPDGAGISYGFCQFTHRSGALVEVLAVYLRTGGAVAREIIEGRIKQAKNSSRSSLMVLAADEAFKKALRAAAVTREMKAAQIATAMRRYVEPAVIECGRMKFASALSLAVVCDSMVHGSWIALRDRTTADLVQRFPQKRDTAAQEKLWVTEYVRRRNEWLGSREVLSPTRYRTQFFLQQIAVSNWDLRLPATVHGVKLTDGIVENLRGLVKMAANNSAVEPEPAATGNGPTSIPLAPYQETSVDPPMKSAQPPDQQKGQAGEVLDAVERNVDRAAARYDQVERVVNAVVRRNDAAKSLWTTVAGSIGQTIWAVVGLLAGVPREVWFVVAVIAALLMLMYLYRQVALGKIREKASAFSPPGGTAT